MESILPAHEGTNVGLLAALLSVCLGVAGYLYIQHNKYRDKREDDDRTYRNEQTKLQAEQWDRESKARDAFRIGFEQRSDKRFDGLESDADAFHDEVQTILKSQQGQISQLKSIVDRLTWEKEHKKPKEE